MLASPCALDWIGYNAVDNQGEVVDFLQKYWKNLWSLTPVTLFSSKILVFVSNIICCCSFVCSQAHPKIGLVCTSFSCPIMNIHLILFTMIHPGGRQNYWYLELLVSASRRIWMSHGENIRSYLPLQCNSYAGPIFFRNIFLVQKFIIFFH